MPFAPTRFFRFFLKFSFILLALPWSTAQAATLNVPQDFPTIQAAINAAQNGETVLVAPGTYVETIDFHGKAITVTSAQGPSLTIIDGGRLDSVATFVSGEGPEAAGRTVSNAWPPLLR